MVDPDWVFENAKEAAELIERLTIDKDALHHDLTEAFIGYQHRLEYPMPAANETAEALRVKYYADRMFHTKVRSLTVAVMHLVDKHTGEGA